MNDFGAGLKKVNDRITTTLSKEVPREGAGTVFPTGVSAGYTFFRTDYMLACVFDGTRWVTQSHYSVNFNQNATPIPGGASYVIGPIRQDVAPFVDRIQVEFLVNGVNNAANYWNIFLRGVNSAYTAATTIDVFNTSAVAGATWTNVDRAPNTNTIPTNRALFDVTVGIALGAPAALILSVNIYYRLIIP